MVGHAWRNADGRFIQHWITAEEDNPYYRYRADDVVSCDDCEGTIPKQSSGQRFTGTQ
jgi:hypothetical protein